MSILFNPASVIFINTDLTDQVLGVFVSQLFITQVMDAATFDAIVAGNPDYYEQVHMDGYRVLVLRDLWDKTNRELADIVLFAKAGLVSVEHCKYGPPRATLPIARVYLTDLINLEKYNRYWHEWRSSHAYERSWKGEPTNNGDFNPYRLDNPHGRVEPPDE